MLPREKPVIQEIKNFVYTLPVMRGNEKDFGKVLVVSDLKAKT